MAVEGMTESLAGLEMASNSSSDKTADYKKLIEYGLDAKVADKLDEIYKVEITKILYICNPKQIVYYATLLERKKTINGK